MKKKALTIIICAILILCVLLIVPISSRADAAKNGTIFFMAANESILALDDETMPYFVNGKLYVPYIMFDGNNERARLSTFAQYNRQSGVLFIYNKEDTLICDLNNNSTKLNNVDVGLKVIRKNSMVFFPLVDICYLLDLEWSWMGCDQGDIIRIKDENARLNDSEFLQAAGYTLQNRYQSYIKETQSNTNTEVTPSAPIQTPNNTPQSKPQDKTKAKIYFAFQMSDGTGMDDLLTTMKNNNAFGVFFCKPDELAGRDDDIRKLLGMGHKIGLHLDADTVEGQQEQFRRGNDLLTHIARMETYICMSEGLTRTERNSLEQMVLWETTINALSEGRNQSKQVKSVLDGVKAEKNYFIMMDDSRQSASALSSILPQLTEKGATICFANEVVLQNKKGS